MSVFIRCLGLACLALATISSPLAQTAHPEPALAIAASDAQLKWGPCPAFMPEGCGLAVLHGDPASPNSDVLLRVPAGQHIAHHWHSSAERMILVSGELDVAYDGQKPATLTPGMYAYGPARLPHHATCRSAGPCVLFIAFEGPIDAVATASGTP